MNIEKRYAGLRVLSIPVSSGRATFRERSDVVGVVADRVEGTGYRPLGRLVVAGDRQHGALGVTGRARQAAEVADVDVGERLDDTGFRKVSP
jgi:hypothetical protein